MPPYIQRDLVNADSQLNRFMDSGFPSPDIFDVANQIQCSEFTESSFTDFSSSSIDELSKVTAIIGHNQSVKKRKLEFDDVEVASQKQRADNDICLLESSKAKTDTRNEKLKPKMDQTRDYIHVRARRGQATDNHSIAERARREKLKKKMQFLQDIVPGCNKLTNKAAILDEIISYVHCLQMEVEFLTMQLAASTTSLRLQDGQLIA
ncbi:hypothetical protein L1887_08279 [Cichorium endivia]|nr:hypothetical protein L1887_08279 [Cichorium endivia]